GAAPADQQHIRGAVYAGVDRGGREGLRGWRELIRSSTGGTRRQRCRVRAVRIRARCKAGCRGLVVDLLGIAAWADVIAEDDRRYRVNRAARVLIEVTTSQLL